MQEGHFHSAARHILGQWFSKHANSTVYKPLMTWFRGFMSQHCHLVVKQQPDNMKGWKDSEVNASAGAWFNVTSHYHSNDPKNLPLWLTAANRQEMPPRKLDATCSFTKLQSDFQCQDLSNRNKEAILQVPALLESHYNFSSAGSNGVNREKTLKKNNEKWILLLTDAAVYSHLCCAQSFPRV